jgi:NAD(P)-dependent dehydrogenase (short-subunit alcohol dehydrogenase family)
MSSFVNRVALVTGAGSGIGRQLARTLSQEGAAIAAVDLQPEPLESLTAELKGQRVAAAVADVTDRAALGKAVARLREQLGGIDLLIASAGIGRETTALSMCADDIEAQVRVNLIGVANSIEAVLPDMIARRNGQLVAISSLASFRGLPRMAGYCASKAGLNALLEAFRVELKPFGIGVTTICPGWIRTPLTANINVPQSDLMEVEEAARRIVAAIRDRRRFYAFPPRIAWRLRLLGWLPSSAADWVIARALARLGRR